MTALSGRATPRLASAPSAPVSPLPPRRTSSFASSLSSSSRGAGAGPPGSYSATALSRQAARLGIVTAYRDLNLHSAAAKGNIGLVQYALANGQPVNSVLDGVLPIHAAASSGSEPVVRMLVEAGADVNSPRLSRRYTREGTKPSGHSVGTRGSTPLHFAAANGHLRILRLLLSYGADPRTPEKHGATAEQMAAQNGFLDAADLLHSYAVKLDRAADTSGAGDRNVPTRVEPQKPPSKGTSLRSFGGLRRKSSSAVGTALHAQRSLDALATKFVHHAHRASSSSLSVNSIRGLTPLASTSQISLGAADAFAPPPPPAASSSTLPNHRRTSLPGAPMRPLLEVGHDGRVRAATLGAGGDSSGPRVSMSTEWTPTSRDESEDESDPAVAAERAERRRSMEVNRPLRQDSFQTGLPTLASLDMAGLPSLDHSTDDPDPTPVETRPPVSPTMRTPSQSAGASSSSQQRFYRPRQSSGLSKGSFTDSRPSLDEDREGRVFEDDDVPDEVGTMPTPTRPRAVSNPDSRSPLLQHLHATQYPGPRSPRPREPTSETNPATQPKQGAHLAVPPAPSTQAYGADAGRTRSNSTSTDASYTISSTSSSAWSGPTTFSTATTSTAPTTAPPHSPTKRTKATTASPDLGYFGAAAIDLSNRRHLGPLYEANSPGIVTGARPPTTMRSEEAPDPAPKTRAQARSRVKKAERELLGSLAPGSSVSAGASSVLRETSSTAAVSQSLKDQLAAYGKSLRAERDLVEKEERDRQRSGKLSGYTIETISSTKSAIGSSKTRSNVPDASKAALPTARSGPPPRRRAPSPTTSSRQSRSPGSSAAATPRAGQSPREPSPAHFATPAAVTATKARSHMDQVRASSPSSTRSGSTKSVSTATEAVPALRGDSQPVLGQGHGGVSFVGIQSPGRNSHHHHHRRPDGSYPPEAARTGSRPTTSGTRSSDRSQSDRDLASVASGGGDSSSSYAGPISTRNGVEEERRRREQEAQKVPKAMRTVPGRTGFVRKLFGSKGGSVSKE